MKQWNKLHVLLAILGLVLGGLFFFVFPRTHAPETPLATSTDVLTEGVGTTSRDLGTPAPGTKTAVTQKTTGVTGTSSVAPKTTSTATGRIAPELVRPTGYSNIDALGILSSEQFTLRRYLGQKVILLEFWTSSSVSAIRTMPYLNQWYEKYKKDGLLVVAVHTPQFTFERSKSVVDKVAFEQEMAFPIIIDNEYNTWNAYKNTVWPHLYLIDVNGKIVYDRAGDGGYEATEAKIAQQLTLRADKLGVAFTAQAFRVPKDAYVSDTSKLGSGEVYFGAARNQSLYSGSALKEGVQTFERPTTLPLNKIGMVGNWNFTKEYAQTLTESSSFLYRYRAKDVFATFSSDKLIRVKILRDGVPLDVNNAGKEIRFEKGESVFYVKDARIYDIITDKAGYGEHQIELIPESGGLNVYSLMFG